jgi:hypothetical protein
MKNGDRITRRIKKLERSQLFIASLYVATPHFRRLTTSPHGFFSSNQQSLDLRQTYGGGYGRYFIRINNTQLSRLEGVVYVKVFSAPLELILLRPERGASLQWV